MTPPNSSDVAADYLAVRMWASTVCFLIMAFFNLIINWTIVCEERLRRHARFVLIFHLLFSALVYFGVCSAFHLQMYVRASPPPAACRAVVTLLITSASNILLTLTAMALDRYCAVCFPLKYSAGCSWHWPWLTGLLTWGLAAVIPLTLLADGDAPKPCNREQLRKGSVHKMVLISVCFAVILFSYARILQESRRLGVLNRSNSMGRRTIALHGTQLAVYLLPNFVNFLLQCLERSGQLRSDTRSLCGVLVFAFFSAAQCVAPVVYGLRKEELLEDLQRHFPGLVCNVAGLLKWTVRRTHPGLPACPRERASTSQRLISQELPQTSV
ncbi:odorant receptor 131-2 [Scleropages formosus]|uniref:Zgc:194312 n=1 Tax=Scleropages formosus TaxID=113540 RepID=A0A8C9SPM4_SCLFO|nr:odorant receptor 131-2-like [Scleropages formosus]